MPAMTNLSVNDDATSQGTITLIPITDTPDPLWRSAIAGVPFEGQVKFTQSMVKQKNGNFKLTVKLEVPVMETLGASGSSAGYVAPPKVAYVTTAILSVFVDRRSTIADRSNTMRMLQALLAGATAAGGSGSINGGSIGDVYKNNTATVPYFFSNLILGT